MHVSTLTFNSIMPLTQLRGDASIAHGSGGGFMWYIISCSHHMFRINIDPHMQLSLDASATLLFPSMPLSYLPPSVARYIFFHNSIFYFFAFIFSTIFSQSNSQQTSLYLISMERLISWPSTTRVPMLPHTTGIIGDRCPRSTSITTGTLYFPMIPSTA